MRVRLLYVADRLVHLVLPSWVPLPLWIYRICCALDAEADRRGEWERWM